MDDISERPSKLIHNIFIENGKVSTILFRINIYNNTLTHVLNTITEKKQAISEEIFIINVGNCQCQCEFIFFQKMESRPNSGWFYNLTYGPKVLGKIQWLKTLIKIVLYFY
jgi:hypothetical protein